ncbi:MAG: V-type ATP synthase subunit D [Thermoplasmata archaeon]|nr:V-type ATP synthase subunit D [Thermoplasmata archaeon]
MALENVRPTRLELLRTRRRIQVAKRGLNLLKLKRTALIQEFFALSRAARELRGDLQRKVARGYGSIRMAEMLEGPIRLENVAMLIPQIIPVRVATKNVMGVRTPRLYGAAYVPLEAPQLLDLPTSVDESIRHFQGIYQVVLNIAEKENAMRRLLKEIERTKRRANAIENVLVPRLESTVRYIKFRFDELERDSFSMLKTVKRKIERAAEAAEGVAVEG